MKPKIVLLISCFAMLASACVNTRYSANAEYDDVYFTSADKAQAPVVDAQDTKTYTSNEDADNYQYRTRTSQGNNFNSYRDDVYDEDDFYFSRRLRRFGSSSSQSWRYYDPYYSNDLYYVMGSSSWNRWNNNGWYSWNRPRFGSSLNWRYANDPFYGGLYDTWGYNYQNYYNYYNPWVNTYYGFAPSFGYNSFFGGGFGNPYASFGYGGFGNPYCPPYAYTSGGSAGYANSRSWNRYYVGRRASSTSSVATNTGYGRNARQLQTREDKRKVATPAGYTSTRTNATPNSGMYLAPKTRTQTVTNTRTSASTRPSNTSRVNSRPSGRTSSPSVYTRPNRTNRTATNVRTGRNSNTRPSNTYTRPSRRTTTRPSNNSYSRPSSRNTYSRPSSSRSSNSYSRPSSSRPSNSSYSRPSSSRPSSRSVRPSSSSSSSRPSSSARVRP